ncbi:putative leucine-rich repeat-containing protein DDB_G0290503 [Nasonia vitripennis]|uniref:Uncharacterized protein n=1 Tax=Nasonia vitripennis TaxID=7425 RepID=A0A7M7H7R5_NASVI|nr:putative leucine-rich repeat-containing protein DDB_G0290503 [Nasonia vitripennis]XP_008212810.1 putative leucine-rich repeat-containing protein DDB_G0290503 [Nasonia vitripennis]
MENNPSGNKRNYGNSPHPNSPRKAQKVDWQQNAPTSSSSPKKTAAVLQNLSKSTSSTTLNSKMSNAAKLRQQFIEEVKDIELSLKETIKNYKSKISEAEKKSAFITEKLREKNKLLCHKSEIIFTKERENKILREKVLELYDYQKIVFENMEDISNTLGAQKDLSDNLQNVYDSVMIMQQNTNEMLEEKLNEITPDQNYCDDLTELNMKINELEKNIHQNENLNHELESKIKAAKHNKQEEQKMINDLDKKINEVETRNNLMKQNAEKEKNDLLQEINNLKQEEKTQTVKMTELDSTISKLEQELQSNRMQDNEVGLEINQINDEIKSLSEENEKLKKNRCKEDEEQAVTLQQLKEQLKLSQSKLASIKQKENQVSNVLKTKNEELRTKLKGYDGIEVKVQKLDLAVNKEQEAITQITEESESKIREYNNKIKLIEKDIIEVKMKIKQKESKVQESTEKIRSLEEEVLQLNEKLTANLNMRKKNTEKQVVGPSGLPELFTSDGIHNAEKQKNRKKLYTPTLADDDLEIDSLSIEDQLNHLTQSKSSNSHSPEKSKRFFKNSTLSQAKSKKESTPRGRGRAKRN